MKHRDRQRLVDKIARLGDAGLRLDVLIDEAGEAIAGTIPHLGACWHTMDPVTVIETRFRTMNLPPHDGRIAEFEYLRDDFNKFVDLARGPRHSGVLSEATEGDLTRSVRGREFNDRYGVRGELRASLVADGVCWGSFVLFREAPDDFSSAERDAAHDLALVLGHGFRTAIARGGATTASPARGPGLILLDGDRRVELMTGTAREWLDELQFDGEPAYDGLPHAVRAVAESARVAGSDATAHVQGASGRWIALHASPAPANRGTAPTATGQPTDTAGRVAVIAQAAAAPTIAPLIAAAYGLTPREREVTSLVLQGNATGEIAARLYISPHTVQEHLKSIFTKAGVRSRRELVGQVFLRHYEPRIQPIDGTTRQSARHHLHGLEAPPGR